MAPFLAIKYLKGTGEGVKCDVGTGGGVAKILLQENTYIPSNSAKQVTLGYVKYEIMNSNPVSLKKQFLKINLILTHIHQLH